MATTTIFAIGVFTTVLLAIFLYETLHLLRTTGEPLPRPLRASGPAPPARPMRVLLGVDGSPCSELAARSVTQRLWPAGTEVEIATVVYASLPTTVEFSPTEAAIRDRALEEDRLQAPERLERAKQLLETTAGVVIHTTVLEGEPARALVDEAARWNADLVVIGSHVYSAVHRALLGSVSEHVAVHAPCSVELARCPEPTTS